MQVSIAVLANKSTPWELGAFVLVCTNQEVLHGTQRDLYSLLFSASKNSIDVYILFIDLTVVLLKEILKEAFYLPHQYQTFFSNICYINCTL